MSGIDGLRPTQLEVYETLRRYGPLPDHALVPLAQHVVRIPQSSSGIRSRRAELARSGFVESINEVTMPSGRKAHVWAAV